MRQHNTLLVRLTDDADFQLADDVNMAQDADDQDTTREDGNNKLSNNEEIMEAKDAENNEEIMEAKDAQWEESKHPRADNGQFTSGSGGGGGKSGFMNPDQKLTQKGAKLVQSQLSKHLSNSRKNYFRENYNNAAEGLKIYRDLFVSRNALTKLHHTPGYKVDENAMYKKVAELEHKFAEWEKKNRKFNLTAQDSVSKEENKMAEELKARDGDLVIKHDDEEEEVKDASVDKRELIREIGAIAGQAGMSEELVRTLMQKAEQLAYNGSEQSEATDACGKDEDAEMEEDFKEAEDFDDEKDDEKISKLVEKKVEDALNGIDFLALVEAKKNMLEKVRPLVGDFDASKMTNNDIAKYACDKLNIKATSDSANDVLNCYLKMKGNTKIYSTVDSMDESADDIIARYKRGE